MDFCLAEWFTRHCSCHCNGKHRFWYFLRVVRSRNGSVDEQRSIFSYYVENAMARFNPKNNPVNHYLHRDFICVT